MTPAVRGSAKRRPTSRWRAMTAPLLAVLGTLAATPATNAHPHVWIDSSMVVHFNDDGRIDALTMVWRFDDLYSVFAIKGADQDQDGKTTPEELHAMAADTVQHLKEWKYFSDIRFGATELRAGAIRSFDNIDDDGILQFSFTMPLSDPVDPMTQPLRVTSYDPSYFIAFQNDTEHASRAEGPMPDMCRIVTYDPDEEQTTVADNLAMALSTDRTWAAKYGPKTVVECAQ